jgi:hypothetical protein
MHNHTSLAGDSVPVAPNRRRPAGSSHAVCWGLSDYRWGADERAVNGTPMHYALTIAHVCPSPLTTTPTAQLVSLQVKSGKSTDDTQEEKAEKTEMAGARGSSAVSAPSAVSSWVSLFCWALSKKKRERLLAAPSPTELSAFNVQL